MSRALREATQYRDRQYVGTTCGHAAGRSCRAGLSLAFCGATLGATPLSQAMIQSRRFRYACKRRPPPLVGRPHLAHVASNAFAGATAIGASGGKAAQAY